MRIENFSKKNFSPDFMLGKLLVFGKSILQILIYIIEKSDADSIRIAKIILRIKPKYSMVRNANLINLYNLVQETNRMNLTGDIVECGVWNGGSAALMGVACKDLPYSKNRFIWLFDSFQGLPPPGANDTKNEREAFFEGRNTGEIAKVEEVISKFGISMEYVKIVPGWFENTLNSVSIGKISLLHIDADWYDSVMIVLDRFYPKVVSGGFIVLDDYQYWPACKKATLDYFSRHNIDPSIITLVGTDGAFFQKL